LEKYIPGINDEADGIDVIMHPSCHMKVSVSTVSWLEAFWPASRCSVISGLSEFVVAVTQRDGLQNSPYLANVCKTCSKAYNLEPIQHELEL